MPIRSSHPLQDGRIGDIASVTRLEDPVIGWSEALSDLVVRMRRSSKRDIVVVIPEKARITPAFDRLSQRTALQVVVEEPDGYRRLRTGWFAQTLGDAVEQPDRTGNHAEGPGAVESAGAPGADSAPPPPARVSPRFLQVPPLVPQLVVSASMFQPARRSTSLGRTVELATLQLLGEDAEISWGRYEPVGSLWDRDALTRLSRSLMPQAHFTLAAHSEHGTASGTLSVSRSSTGLEEYTELSLAPSQSFLPTQEHGPQAMELLRHLALEARPQLVLVSQIHALPDTALPTTTRIPPAPLALAIGPGGIHQLGVDPKVVASRHGGEVVGRGRRRGVAVPLATGRAADWSTLTGLLRTLDSEGRLLQALGAEQPATPPARTLGAATPAVTVGTAEEAGAAGTTPRLVPGSAQNGPPRPRPTPPGPPRPEPGREGEALRPGGTRAP